MRKSRWWVAAATGALAAALLAPVSSAQSSSGPAPAAAEGEPISDPIPEDPVALAAGAGARGVPPVPEDRARRPAPTDQRLMRQARINYIGEVPDGIRPAVRARPERHAVPPRRRPAAPLPRRPGRSSPDFFSGRGMGSGFGFVAFHPEFEENGKFYTVHTEKFARPQHQADDVPARSRTRSSTAW